MIGFERAKGQVSASEKDWEFQESDTRYLTHDVHRYSGKFIPQIAREVIQTVSKPGETVLDFYSGSGTTLLEAALLGRQSIGVDLSPLAVLISKVKTTPVSEKKLGSLTEFFQDRLLPFVDDRSRLSKSVLANIERNWRYGDEWFSKWFSERVLRDLIFIFFAIEELEDEPSRNIAWVAFSDILRRVSNAHSGYPNVMYDKTKVVRVNVLSLFQERLEFIREKVAGLGQEPLLKKYRPRVLHGSALALPIEDEAIDAIVTHPPYLGSIPYAEYGALSLRWLGHCPKELDRALTGGRRQSRDVVERFAAEYMKTLSEAQRVLKDRRILFVMVGNPVVKGSRVDLTEMTVEFCRELGMPLVDTAKRLGVNRRANKMGAESLLFFSKGRAR